MAKFSMHYHSYDINSLADLAMVRAQLEELHNQKKIPDSEYKLKTNELDQFARNHSLK